MRLMNILIKFKPMKILLIIFSLFIYFPANAEDKEIEKIFNGINGTIIITSLNTGQQYSHNDVRAKQRFSTASTFKLFNTLIALQENAIKPDEILKWDGKIYE
ncbi:partial putative beta-lactamase YbxI, partial [Patescibacteria group bacterium]